MRMKLIRQRKKWSFKKNFYVSVGDSKRFFNKETPCHYLNSFLTSVKINVGRILNNFEPRNLVCLILSVSEKEIETPFAYLFFH